MNADERECEIELGPSIFWFQVSLWVGGVSDPFRAIVLTWLKLAGELRASLIMAQRDDPRSQALIGRGPDCAAWPSRSANARNEGGSSLAGGWAGGAGGFRKRWCDFGFPDLRGSYARILPSGSTCRREHGW